MVACPYYFLDTIIRLWRLKDRQPSFLLPFGIGLFLWFLGGLNDGFLTVGVISFTSEKILWFASFWPSMFLIVAVVLHFRSLELSVREELRRLSHAKDRTINHLSHELKTPLAVMGGHPYYQAKDGFTLVIRPLGWSLERIGKDGKAT